MRESTIENRSSVSVIEAPPSDMREDAKAVGLLSNALIRFVIEDAEAEGIQPLDLLAERLGVNPNALWIAAERAGVLKLLVRTPNEVTLEDAGTALLAAAAPSKPAFGEHDAHECDMLTKVEHLAMDKLLRLSGELEPLVTAGEYQKGAGIDPQLSDRYRTWLTRLETQVFRKGTYPQNKEEMGFGELPDLSMSSTFSPQCVVGYDGPEVMFMADTTPLNPWYWTSPHCVVSWPDGKQVADLTTIAGIVDKDALRGLEYAITEAMREENTPALLGWKVITRKPQTHIAKGEMLVAGIRVLGKLANGTEIHDCEWDTFQATIEQHGYHPVSSNDVPGATRVAKEILRKEADAHLHKAANYKLWDTLVDGVPCKVAPGESEPEITKHPEFSLTARIIHAIRRKAAKKAHTRTAIAWIDPDALHASYRTAIAPVLPIRGDWAIQVWFDPYDCGVADIEAAATAPRYSKKVQA